MAFRSYLAAAVAALCMLTFTATDVDAKRLGGGRSLGMQRSAPAQQAAPAPQNPAAAQQPAKPAVQPAPQAPAQPAPQAGGSRWLGPLAGLAAGIGLAALASHFGFGEQMANGLMIALLVMLGIVVFGWLIRRVLPSPAPATAGGPGGNDMARSRMDVAPDTWQPAGRSASAGATASPMTSDSSDATRLAAADAPDTVFGHHADSASVSGTAAESVHTFTLPAGFDAYAFVRQAKVNFIRLQAANDEGNLDDLREFTTPEIYAELKLDIDARRGAAQKTEVVDLDVSIVDYAEESDRWVVSVRYTGRLYEDASVVSSEVDEVWHLTKPRDGKSGWLVAGMQQLS
jgi:predicted lipid-binding transport protein (Tim44 family)